MRFANPPSVMYNQRASPIFQLKERVVKQLISHQFLGILIVSIALAAVGPANADVEIIPRSQWHPNKLVAHTKAPQDIRQKYKEVLLEGALTPLDRNGKDAFEYLTVHATTVPKSPAKIEDATKELQLMVQRGYQPNPTTYSYMADVPYHYFISRDGKVAEGRQLIYPARTNTPNSDYGRNIKKHLTVVIQDAFVLGPDGKPLKTFETLPPTEQQFSALIELLDMLARKHKIKIDKVGYHKQHAPKASGCPGPYVIKRFPKIVAELKNRGG